ncbi:Kinase protein with tetratricopeptide repeat domain [Hibiscus syriacus]|uniref:Kinase protein with tetratricopeptide repeat domain n=1 Tax=Hibiscus syriacus TaxID=106335 RepID=A0A6A2YKZ7_HIBSY|nr:Kinase protein with tetratricopeptide repeat domain [Hibiscus syriacus]
MSSLEMSHVDLEQGITHRRNGSDISSDEASVGFSDADEGSSYSQFYSSVAGSYCASDGEIGDASDSRRVSSVSNKSDDLAAAHKHCAEVWFKIRGNKTCEICHSIAHNVVGVTEIESTDQSNETNSSTAMAAVTVPTPHIESQSFWQGHRFLNFLLACMVFCIRRIMPVSLQRSVDLKLFRTVPETKTRRTTNRNNREGTRRNVLLQ